MRLALFILALLISGIVRSAHAQTPGLPVIDFQRYFPHLVAVSEEVKDADFPQGVQYKFLTIRDQKENTIVLALVRREGKERAVRVFLAKGPVETSESTLRDGVAKFSEETQMRFEFVDLRSVRTFVMTQPFLHRSGC